MANAFTDGKRWRESNGQCMEEDNLPNVKKMGTIYWRAYRDPYYRQVTIITMQ